MAVRDAFEEHRRLLDACAGIPDVVERIAEQVWASLRAGGRIFVCGNGGSAADAQHFAAEMTGRCDEDRHPLAAVALTTDTSVLTAIANDYGYEHVFARQLRALARTGDVVICISTSGGSPSVIEAARVGRAVGCRVVGMVGEGGGKLGALCDDLVAVPSRRVSRIQEIHGICLHALARAIEERGLRGGA